MSSGTADEPPVLPPYLHKLKIFSIGPFTAKSDRNQNENGFITVSVILPVVHVVTVNCGTRNRQPLYQTQLPKMLCCCPISSPHNTVGGEEVFQFSIYF